MFRLLLRSNLEYSLLSLVFVNFHVAKIQSDHYYIHGYSVTRTLELHWSRVVVPSPHSSNFREQGLDGVLGHLECQEVFVGAGRRLQQLTRERYCRPGSRDETDYECAPA